MVQIMIKVKAGALLDQVRINRKKHDEEYLKAMEGYWTRYESRLQKALAEIGLMKKVTDKGPDNPLAGLVRPESHVEDYDVVISMLEQVKPDSEVELGTDQHKQLWLDDWSWKGQFTATNSLYTN